MSHCRSCNAEITWMETPNGKRTPVNSDGVTHWATCPQARQWGGKTATQEDFLDMAAPKPETREYPQ